MKSFGSYNPAVAAPFIKKWEGYRDVAYKCPLGVWTLGYGHTLHVEEGDLCTKEQASAWLFEDLEKTQQALAPYVNVPVSEQQFIALMSLAFNLGASGVVRKCPKLMRALNVRDYEACADEFLDITNGGVPGLVARRRAESALMREEEN